VWAFSIIFCGHFPEGTQEFTAEECEDESRGHWYFRQLLGSANIRGGKLFHIISGNLSHQIEHHLFPDLPANRYQEIATEVEEVCERYGLPYNSRSFTAQLGSTWRKIWRLALPGS
jgi:NADPH-dependent stearoyl-CoA 9-desaturase